MSDLPLPDDMSGATVEALERDYFRTGQARYEEHENGYRRLSPTRPPNLGVGKGQ